jgi:hypothetical protein
VLTTTSPIDQLTAELAEPRACGVADHDGCPDDPRAALTDRQAVSLFIACS